MTRHDRSSCTRLGWLSPRCGSQEAALSASSTETETPAQHATVIVAVLVAHTWCNESQVTHRAWPGKEPGPMAE